MSVQVLYQADILMDGVAASTEFCRIKFSLNQPVKDKTAFQDVAKSSLPGIYAATADGDVYYQTGLNLVTNKLEAGSAALAPGAFTPIVLTLGADLVVGTIVNIWKGVSAKFEESGGHGEIIKAAITTEAAERTVQATRLIRALNAIAASSGLSPAQQLGAIAANQALYAALHILGTTGSTGTAFSIISSATSSLSSPTTRITFNAGSSVTLGEWQSVAGAITDTWWAFKWTGFLGTVLTASAAAGIQ